jgi:DNA mismatch repair protein MutS2
VLADIGDYQSIQENLSTFSAHVSNIREMALDVTPDSLVLLDELGAATDPEEGGALGVALVEHFRAAGAFTLVSTHLMALKIYGARPMAWSTAPWASTRRPSSPPSACNWACRGNRRAWKSPRGSACPRTSCAAPAGYRPSLERDRLALAARERQLILEQARKETEKMRELEAKFEDMQHRWQERADATVAKITETAERRKAVDEAQRQTSKLKREMREDWEASILPAATAPVRTLKIEEGVRVRVKGIRDLARVRRVLGSDRFEVEAGFMKMQVSAADIDEVFPESSGPAPGKLPKNVRFQAGPALAPSVQEINVIGERAEDAIERVERFLDAAVMATAARVRIVHGHGMGVLKRAVQDLLKKNPHVEKYYPASQYEGGNGATIAELKD